MVARRPREAQIEELQACTTSWNKPPATGNAFFEINERFHMRLLEIADNRWRDQMVADLRKVMKLNRHNSLLKSGRIEESLAEHRAIMAALAARDGAASVQRMREHFRNGLEAAGTPQSRSAPGPESAHGCRACLRRC